MPFDSQSIKKFRQHMRLTQAELAERLGVPQPTVARWESERAAPCARHIGMLCDMGRTRGINPSFFFPNFSHYEPEAHL